MNMTDNKDKYISINAFENHGVTLFAVCSDYLPERIFQTYNNESAFRVLYIKCGVLNCIINGKEVALHSGNAFVSSYDDTVIFDDSASFRGNAYLLIIDLRNDNIFGLNNAGSSILKNSVCLIRKGKLHIPRKTADRLISAFDHAERAELVNLIAAESLLSAFICDLSLSSEKDDENSGISSQIEKAKRYIDENIKDSLSLDIIAAQIGFSLSHFKFKFKNEIGIPPGEYIMRNKILDSVSLLPDRSLTYIAYEYSFSSLQHYSKNFKSVIGMTPKEYRRLLKNKSD